MKQLIFTFPEDAATSTGAPFWSAPKRFPRFGRLINVINLICIPIIYLLLLLQFRESVTFILTFINVGNFIRKFSHKIYPENMCIDSFDL